MSRTYPFIVEINRIGEIIKTVFIDDYHFRNRTNLNIKTGKIHKQFVTLDKIADDILVSHIVEKGSIELLRISTEGKLLEEYRIDGLPMSKPAFAKIGILRENPLKVAVFDSSHDFTQNT